jgi:hypothetical protein
MFRFLHKDFLFIFSDVFGQRGNRLREYLSTFITLHKAGVLYYWEVAADTKFFQDSSLGNAVWSIGCRTK